MPQRAFGTPAAQSVPDSAPNLAIVAVPRSSAARALSRLNLFDNHLSALCHQGYQLGIAKFGKRMRATGFNLHLFGKKRRGSLVLLQHDGLCKRSVDGCLAELHPAHDLGHGQSFRPQFLIFFTTWR